MNGIKAPLIALAMLAGATTAHASTVAIFDVSETGSSPYSNQSLSGTAVLDSAGTMTVTLSGTLTGAGLLAGMGTADVSSVKQFNGAIVGGVFTSTGGTSTLTSCTNNDTACSYFATSLNVATAFTSVSGSLDVATGGTLVGAVTASGITLTATDALTPQAVAPVPVPATAWLFGSGLAGLAGITRRRSKQS